MLNYNVYKLELEKKLLEEYHEVIEVAHQKVKKRGGFDKKIYLIGVDKNN